MCDAAAKKCPSIWPGMREWHVWPLEDPAAFTGTEEERLGKFREVRDAIEEKLGGRVAGIRESGTT